MGDRVDADADAPFGTRRIERDARGRDLFERVSKKLGGPLPFLAGELELLVGRFLRSLVGLRLFDNDLPVILEPVVDGSRSGRNPAKRRGAEGASRANDERARVELSQAARACRGSQSSRTSRKRMYAGRRALAAQRPYGLGVQTRSAHLCRVAGQGMQVAHDAAVGIAHKGGGRNLLVGVRIENTAGLRTGTLLDTCGLGGLNGCALGVVGAGTAYGNAEVPAGGGRIGGVL